ncbi:hypothetical protein CY34DRAFT_809676 [Suillus luteus UH-Slu-Lm8-n1]|uniref:Uncharacterized protein n=1 Tax=Suillus luteus UH-Slu-Lm8-n1 TaxID=930992 RepID=A0A0D0AJ31_9AGAM|nr:hypothetical protein CY34DRAFT_809676 [Suillus luteus UH-Slu-Lm8-n1]
MDSPESAAQARISTSIISDCEHCTARRLPARTEFFRTSIKDGDKGDGAGEDPDGPKNLLAGLCRKQSGRVRLSMQQRCAPLDCTEHWTDSWEIAGTSPSNANG